MTTLLEAVQNLPGALVGTAMRAVPLAMAMPQAAESSFTNTMVTNVPGPTKPLYLLGARLTLITGCPPLIDYGGLLHSVSSYDGRFLLSFTTRVAICCPMRTSTGSACRRRWRRW